MQGSLKNVSEKQYGKFIPVLLFVISFLASLMTSNNIWKSTISGPDSSVFLYIGKMITKGYIPYRDTFDHKGPLLYLINAIGYSISPRIGVWIIELFFLFGTVFFIFRCASLFLDNIKSLIVTLVCVAQLAYFLEGGNLAEEYAMLFLAYSMFVFVDYFKSGNITRLRLVLTGVSFAAVCLIRANMISVWIVFCLAVLVQCFRYQNFKELGRYLLFFILGAVILALPFMVWLSANNALDDFVNAYLRFNAAYTKDPELGGVKNIIISLIDFYEYPIVTIVFASAVFVTFKEHRKLDVLYLIYLIVTMALMCMSGRNYPHYAMVLIPALVYPFTRLVEILEDTDSKTCNAAIFMTSIALVLPCIARYGNIVVLNRTYSDRDQTIFNICNVIDRNSEEGDKIIVNGNEDCIYLLSDRDSLSKYSYQSPVAKISPDIAKEYYKDLRTKKAKLVVFSNSDWNYKEVKNIIEDLNYRQIVEESIGVDPGKYSIYVYGLDE